MSDFHKRKLNKLMNKLGTAVYINPTSRTYLEGRLENIFTDLNNKIIYGGVLFNETIMISYPIEVIRTVI